MAQETADHLRVFQHALLAGGVAVAHEGYQAHVGQSGEAHLQELPGGASRNSPTSFSACHGPRPENLLRGLASGASTWRWVKNTYPKWHPGK